MERRRAQVEFFAVRHAVRIGAARRRFASCLVLLTAGVIVCAFFLAATANAEQSAPVRTHLVLAGDTLYGIAKANTQGDVRVYIDKVKELNHLASATIRPGEVLALPAR